MADADSTPDVSGGLRRRRVPKLCFWISMTGVTLGLFLYAGIRWHATAELQRCFSRNYEITFNESGQPAYLPALVDDWVYSGLDWLENRGHIGDAMVVRERFRMLFRKPVRDIDIHYPNTTSEEIGDALRRFPRLEAFCINEVDSRWMPGPPGMRPLAEALGELTHLREVEIESTHLDDFFFREISTLPALETLILTQCYVPGNFVTLLEESPGLKRLSLWDCYFTEENPTSVAASLAADQQASMSRILESIEKLKHLRELDLASFSMGEQNLERIAALSKIECLSLGHCRLPEDFPRILAESGKLRRLRLWHLKIDPRVSDTYIAPEDPPARMVRDWNATEEDEKRFEKAGIRLNK